VRVRVRVEWLLCGTPPIKKINPGLLGRVEVGSCIPAIRSQ
jgi:hypothetical protein